MRSNKIILVCVAFLSFAILCVGLFFAAANYANRPAGSDAVLSDTVTSDTAQDTDFITDFTSTSSDDAATDETSDAVDETLPLPKNGEEYSTSPLPQWSFQSKFCDKIIEIARNEPAEAEDANGVTKYGTYFGDPTGQWCTEFAVWCVIQAQEHFGVEYVKVYYPKSDYSGGCISWYKKRDCYYPKGKYIPRRGDMIFFEYDGDSVSDHTGLVTGVEYDEAEQKLYVLTIEGNLPEDYPTGVIRERRLAVDDKLIFGYGTFEYEPQPLPQQGETQ